MPPRRTQRRPKGPGPDRGPAAAPDTLGRRSLRALGWNYAGTAARAVAQLAIGIVLARLLSPEQFGVVAIGWLMVGAGMLVADLGLGVIVVQRPTLTDDDVAFCATAQLVVGCVLCALGVGAAGWVAAWFAKPEAANVVRAMSLLFVVQSAGATPLALMRRDLDFRAAQLVAITSYLLGYVGFGIPAAIHGWGPWSLVGAQLVQAVSATTLAVVRMGMPLRFRLRGRGDVASSGLKVTTANLVSYALLNFDSIAVGRSLGAEALGLYGRAMALVQTPAAALTAGLQGVLLAACSRAQADLRVVRKALLASMGAFASLVFPVFLTVAAVPATIVEALYGRAWLPAAPVLAALSVGFAVGSVAILPGPILGARNRFGTELRLQSMVLAVLVPAVVVASRASAVAVAWTVAAVRVAQLVVLSYAAGAEVGASLRSIARVLAWPAAVAVSVAAVTGTADRALAAVPAAGRLAADVLVSAAALAGCVRLFGRAWASASEFTTVLPLDRLPRFLRGWVVGGPAAGASAPSAGRSPTDVLPR